MRSKLLLIRQDKQTIEEQMAPWRKEIRIEGYWGEPVTEEEKQDLIDDYIRDMRDIYEEEVDNPSFEEAYQEHGEIYNENAWRKDENDVWRHWIEWEYNPDGIWDHYVIEKIARKGVVPNINDLDYDDLLLNGEWISVNGKVYDYIKDLPDDAELVSICYHFVYHGFCYRI